MATFDPDYTAPEGLPALLSGLLTTAHERHMDLIALVSDLAAEALEWAPGPEAAHISGLVMHILEVEEYLAAVASGQDVEWAGTNGSSMDIAVEAPDLVERVTSVDASLKAALATIPRGRLDTMQPGGDRTVGSMLMEDLDHSAMHYGQVQLTRHLYELAHPEFASGYEH
ncbi:MAG: DinB family protein, partial [Dehalococcoidia bacterium]